MRKNPVTELEILQAVALAPAPVTAREILDRVGLPRATGYRMLSALECDGWLRSEGTPKRFTASMRLVEIGLMALGKEQAHEHLIAGAIPLSREVGMSIAVAMYDNGDTIFMDRVRVYGNRISIMAQGRRFPAMCNAPGKAMLAHMPEAEIERVIQQGQPKFASKTRTTPEELRAEVELTRRQGYGFAHSEAQEGSVGVAMAVFGRNGMVAGALSVGTHVPLQPGYPENVLSKLANAVQQVSADLGYRPHVAEALA